MKSFKGGLSIKKSSKKGFALTTSALMLLMVLISVAFSTSSMSIFLIPPKDPRAQAQARESLTKELVLASQKGIDVQSYLQNVSSLFGNISVSVAKAQPPAPYGVITKLVNGSSGNRIMVYAPNGSLVVVTDGQFVLRGLSIVTQNGFVEIMLPSPSLSGFLIIYDGMPSHSYTGTITSSLNYTLSNPPSIVANSWTPPQGFSQVMIYGAPSLSLIRISNSTGYALAYAVVDPFSQCIGVGGLNIPLTGRIDVLPPSTWYQGDIRGGDVYAYND